MPHPPTARPDASVGNTVCAADFFMALGDVRLHGFPISARVARPLSYGYSTPLYAKSIFRLKIYIFRLSLYICKLKICRFKLKIEFVPRIGKFLTKLASDVVWRGFAWICRFVKYGAATVQVILIMVKQS